MLSKLNTFFKKYPWVPNVVISFMGLMASIILFWFNANISGIAKELVESLREIRANTGTLATNLKENLSGGLPVVVGVNPREIKENIVYIYDNNDLNLKPGDVIFLKNYTDNTFQATLRFIVQKSLPSSEKKSSASIFISDDAAKRIGFYDYRTRGTIMLKMLRSSATTRNSIEEKAIEGNATHQ